MRSPRAFVGSAIIVLSYPVALAVQLLFGGGAGTVIHFVTGAGFVVFATSAFDFGLPPWVSVFGAVAAAIFGAIFVLQGVSDLTQLDGLRYVAYDVLGHEVERLLPFVVYLWLLFESGARREQDQRPSNPDPESTLPYCCGCRSEAV